MNVDTLQSISYINTYIISQYNPSVRNTTFFLTPFMLCALIDFEQQFFGKLSQFLLDICWEDVIEKY